MQSTVGVLEVLADPVRGRLIESPSEDRRTAGDPTDAVIDEFGSVDRPSSARSAVVPRDSATPQAAGHSRRATR